MKLKTIRDKFLLKSISNNSVKKLDNIFEIVKGGFSEITYIIMEKQSKK